MNILIYSSYYYPYISGITVTVLNIVNYFKINNQITILTFNHKKNKLEIENHKNLKIIRLPYLLKISKGFISPQSFFYFFKEIKNTDLIIINLPNVEGLFLTLLGKLFNKKIISIFHCFISYPNKIIEVITNKITQFQMILSNNIFIYTKDYLKQFSIYKKIKNKIIEILPPIKKLIPDKKFLTKLKKLKKKKIWVGFSGRIAREKGIEYLIKAVKKLNKKNYQIIFAGPYSKEVIGEDNYFSKIKSLLEKYQINHLFLGNLNENQLGAFYQAINMLVLPSINHTEAFGMVQPEAMILGTPVIASNLPGVRIPIKLTKMGILVKQKNTNDLELAIKKIIKNKKKYTNKKLIKIAEEIFNINNFYQKFNDFFLNLEKEKFIDKVIVNYLANRPMFFSIIRTLEAVFFYKNKKFIKGKVLDFGCGDGFFAKTVFGEKIIDIGLDLFNSRANEAKKNKIYKKVVFYDGHKVPYSNNYFDTIVSNCVLEHIPNLENSLKEINRVLKPGGYFLTSVMTNNWEKNLFGNKIFGQSYIKFLRKKQEHYNLLSKNQWKKIFEKTGFKIISTYPYLNKTQSQLLDIFHYLSLPSLISYKFFKKWVVFPWWYRFFLLNNIIKKINQKKDTSYSALFLILKKSLIF